MGILKKVQFYKRALQVLIALNVAVLTAGAIAGASYFSSIQFIKVLTQQNVERMQLIQVMQNDLNVLSQASNEKKSANLRIRHLESLRLRLESWPGSNLAQISLPDSFDGTELDPALIVSVRERLVTEEKLLGDQLIDGTSKLGSLTEKLIFLSLSTFLFGILLPILLFRKLMKEMQNAKHKVEEKVSFWIADWFKTYSQHGEKPYQDPSFWLKLILISVEAFAPQSRSPFMQFLADFAPTLRKEIENQKKTVTDTRKAS
jgi:hypothetical protein